jgi:antitoxin component of MazEF toxin-antitoxin module
VAVVISVKVSDNSVIQIPRTLLDALSLSDGDRVQFVRQGDVIVLQRVNGPSASASLEALAGAVSSSRPHGSVDVTATMVRRGYEDLRDPDDM